MKSGELSRSRSLAASILHDLHGLTGDRDYPDVRRGLREVCDGEPIASPERFLAGLLQAMRDAAEMRVVEQARLREETGLPDVPRPRRGRPPRATERSAVSPSEGTRR
jgi:hypothetical protein